MRSTRTALIAALTTCVSTAALAPAQAQQTPRDTFVMAMAIDAVNTLDPGRIGDAVGEEIITNICEPIVAMPQRSGRPKPAATIVALTSPTTEPGTKRERDFGHSPMTASVARPSATVGQWIVPRLAASMATLPGKSAGAFTALSPKKLLICDARMRIAMPFVNARDTG